MSEKKIRKHLQSIWYHHVRLQNALNAARDADVISYADFKTEAPCAAMDELKKRIELTTRETLANTIHREMRQRVRGY